MVHLPLSDPRACFSLSYATGALPNWAAAKIYFGFLIFEGVLAATMPGVRAKVFYFPAHSLDVSNPRVNSDASFALSEGHHSPLLSLSLSLSLTTLQGLPVPSEGHKTLVYDCNGVASWYGTCATANRAILITATDLGVVLRGRY